MNKAAFGRWFSTSNRTNLRKDFSGVYPPLTTPFNKDESISWKSLESNLIKFNETNIKGFLVEGSNGEFCYMTEEERVEMVAKVRELASPDKLVLAGSGCESTQLTVEMTQKMATAGADAAVVITPHYYKSGMTSEALVKHYQTVADGSPMPILLYNVPANTR